MSQPSTTAYENPVSGVTGAEVVAGDILLSSALGGDTVSVGGAAGWVFPTTRSWGAMSALAPRTTPEDSEGALVGDWWNFDHRILQGRAGTFKGRSCVEPFAQQIPNISFDLSH